MLGGIIKMNATLVILAAGLGSRFAGGIKQLEPLGPGGEIIMDYSIYDAIEAGFDKAVFIIRKDIKAAFDQMIGERIKKIVKTDYVFQELDCLPQGFKCPGERVKPWGHGHAVYCCKDVVNEPFVVINADDYYGKQAFVQLYEQLKQMQTVPGKPIPIALAGFELKNTLSDFGSVNRGVCKVKDGQLQSIKETYNIRREADGNIHCGKETDEIIPGDNPVSMNMWACPPEFITKLGEYFESFLEKNADNITAEFLLPWGIEKMIENGDLTCKVTQSSDKWFGITYAEDTPVAKACFKALVDKGVYPGKLWG